MKIFVTGVGGQLGHDVMNELNSRGYEGVGSDIQLVYSGVQDGTYVCTADYRQMDITDKDSVEKYPGAGEAGSGDPLCSLDCCRCSRR